MLDVKKTILLSTLLVAVSAGTILALSVTNHLPQIVIPGITPRTILVDKAALESLPKKSASSANVSRLATGIIPPTNSWLSGMVLQSTPLPVFPMPLSFLAKDSGFEVGLPSVNSNPTVIFGAHTPGISTDISGATGFKLSRYDKVSSSLSYFNGTQLLGKLTLAEGSPFVFYHAQATGTLNLSALGVVSSTSSNYIRYTKAGHDYVVVTNNASINKSGDSASISLSKDSLVTFYALPGGGGDPLKTYASNELSEVTTNYGTSGSNSTTTFNYKTTNNKPTIFVPMNYSQLTGNGSKLTTYDSIYGPMSAVAGSTFKVNTPLIASSTKLDLSHLSADHKKQLISTLQSDVAKTTITPTDSYFAGKALARAANLLDIAEQLGQTTQINQLKTILNAAFSARLGAKYFYYDTTIKGIAAQTKAFGSEDFNDHHFHYGYFIYAAAILGKYDADFLKNNQKQINLLAADIASYDATPDFPIERNFDPYAAHSWAAGLSPFADGNNQESSSEAINAWNGVAAWGNLTKNSQLESSATWMLSSESSTAKAAWRTVDTSASYQKDYKAPLTSLNFGGKRTYATFFSDEPAVKLAIQLIPMNPVMTTLSSDPYINSAINASITNNNYNVTLGDSDLMYMALADPSKALGLVGSQKDSFIDDGNSRTYLDAWVYALNDK
jgi:endoglucanase Acf2